MDDDGILLGSRSLRVCLCSEGPIKLSKCGWLHGVMHEGGKPSRGQGERGFEKSLMLVTVILFAKRAQLHLHARVKEPSVADEAGEFVVSDNNAPTVTA